MRQSEQIKVLCNRLREHQRPCLSHAIDLSERTMKTMCAFAIVFSALTSAAVMGAGAANAATETEGAYCLSDTEYSSRDCSFSSLAQCEQTGAGIGADCAINVFRDEGRSAYGFYTPIAGFKASR
jgi:hypothetical protein